jgi:protein-S-isoprenylcysteine O-methyltransferase Ste14
VSAMTWSHWLIGALWLVLIAYWAIAAIGAKRNVGAAMSWKEGGLRLAILLIVLLALGSPRLRHATASVQAAADVSPLMRVGGVALCALGIALAIFARHRLGRNWGMPMSRKQDPELVTTGPYAVLRHPVYAGLLLAMLGAAMGASVFWLLPLLLFGAYFIYSARQEEKLMLAQFPAQYPAYMRRTRMLVPFLL